MNLLIIEILGSLKKLTRPQKIIFSFLVDTTLFFFAVYISFLITSVCVWKDREHKLNHLWVDHLIIWPLKLQISKILISDFNLIFSVVYLYNYGLKVRRAYVFGVLGLLKQFINIFW